MTLRRDFLAFSAGAVAARTVLPLAARAEEAHSDALLLAACAAFMKVHLAYEAVDRPDNDCSDQEADCLHDAWHDALEVVTATRAKTPDGMRAKARVTIAAFEMDVPRMIDDTVDGVAEPHVLLAWRLAHDILLGTPA